VVESTVYAIGQDSNAWAVAVVLDTMGIDFLAAAQANVFGIQAIVVVEPPVTQVWAVGVEIQVGGRLRVEFQIGQATQGRVRLLQDHVQTHMSR